MDILGVIVGAGIAFVADVVIVIAHWISTGSFPL